MTDRSQMDDFAAFLGGLEFLVNGKGNRPIDRFPWGSRAPTLNGVQGDGPSEPSRKLFQFFVDADGYPVVTTDGHLVHMAESRCVVVA